MTFDDAINLFLNKKKLICPSLMPQITTHLKCVNRIEVSTSQNESNTFLKSDCKYAIKDSDLSF